jgi:hypothetical protein
MSNRALSRYVARATFAMSLFVLGAVGVGGCEPQSEGDRCTGGSGTDECSSGLTCVVPPNCLVSYCCPISQKNPTGICGGCESTDMDTGTDGAGDDRGGDTLLDAPKDSPTDTAGDDTAVATDAAVDDGGADVATDTAPDAASDGD